MSEFELYFALGLEHILDLNGYDHILFVLALCAVYSHDDWKRILILVTAFTIGHSITLAMATLGIIKINSDLVEFLIPITIFITALSNLLNRSTTQTSKISINYAYALFFGLIHGMGFSNYLQSLLGKSASIVAPLFAFNIGLEVGQIIIVVIFMSLGFIAVQHVKIRQRIWTVAISAAIMALSAVLIFEAKFW